MEAFEIESLRLSKRQRHFRRLVLIIMIMIFGLLLATFSILFAGMQSQQNTMNDMMETFNDKQENDTNEIKDTIRNISKSITEIKNHSEKQQDDFTKNKDTMSDVMKSLHYIQQNIKDLKEIVEANNTNLNKQKDDILQIKDNKDISQLIKNMSDLHDRIYKKSDKSCNVISNLPSNFSNTKNLKLEDKNFHQSGAVDTLLNDHVFPQALGLLRTGPKRYILSTDQATFLEAFHKCQNENRALASIDSEEEYNTLTTYIKSVDAKDYWYWTSGTRKDASSEFYWKSSGKPLSYTKWRSGDPDNTNCISIMHYKNNTVMSNYPCDETYRYICEYRE